MTVFPPAPAVPSFRQGKGDRLVGNLRLDDGIAARPGRKGQRPLQAGRRIAALIAQLLDPARAMAEGRDVGRPNTPPQPSPVVGAGSVGTGWVGAALSPSTSDAGTGRSLIGKTGSPVRRFRTKAKPILVGWTRAGVVPPSPGIHQRRGRNGVMVPDVVTDQLARPDRFARLAVQRRDRGSKRDRIQPRAAVVIRTGAGHGQMDQPVFLVHGHGGPDIGRARHSTEVMPPSA